MATDKTLTGELSVPIVVSKPAPPWDGDEN